MGPKNLTFTFIIPPFRSRQCFDERGPEVISLDLKNLGGPGLQAISKASRRGFLVTREAVERGPASALDRAGQTPRPAISSGPTSSTMSRSPGFLAQDRGLRAASPPGEGKGPDFLPRGFSCCPEERERPAFFDIEQDHSRGSPFALESQTQYPQTRISRALSSGRSAAQEARVFPEWTGPASTRTIERLADDHPRIPVRKADVWPLDCWPRPTSR